MDDKDERIRAHAYRLWQEEGRPQGRESIHWDMATELVAIEDNQMLATKPNPLTHPDNRGDFGEPVEPLRAAATVGDLPSLTDQGEEQQMPTPRQEAPEPITRAAPKSAVGKAKAAPSKGAGETPSKAKAKEKSSARTPTGKTGAKKK